MVLLEYCSSRVYLICVLWQPCLFGQLVDSSGRPPSTPYQHRMLKNVRLVASDWQKPGSREQDVCRAVRSGETAVVTDRRISAPLWDSSVKEETSYVLAFVSGSSSKLCRVLESLWHHLQGDTHLSSALALDHHNHLTKRQRYKFIPTNPDIFVGWGIVLFVSLFSNVVWSHILSWDSNIWFRFDSHFHGFTTTTTLNPIRAANTHIYSTHTGEHKLGGSTEQTCFLSSGQPKPQQSGAQPQQFPIDILHYI